MQLFPSIHQYQIIYNIVKPADFPHSHYALASVIRGAMHEAVTTLFCSVPNHTGKKCSLSCDCLYSRLLEINYPIGHPQERHTPPSPYMIFAQPEFLKENKLAFIITLFGESGNASIADLSKILEYMGSNCLGSYQGLIPDTFAPLNQDSTQPNYFKKENEQNLHIRFVSLTRMHKDDGIAASAPPFSLLIWQLRQRFQLLDSIYTAGKCSPTVPPDIQSVESVKIIRTENFSNDRWEKPLRRHSPNKRKDIIGFQGTVIYSGDTAPYMDMLRLGQFTHVGQLTAFGMGKYVII